MGIHEDSRIAYRVGLNIGDIVVGRDDIHRDA